MCALACAPWNGSAPVNGLNGSAPVVVLRGSTSVLAMSGSSPAQYQNGSTPALVLNGSTPVLGCVRLPHVLHLLLTYYSVSPGSDHFLPSETAFHMEHEKPDDACVSQQSALA